MSMNNYDLQVDIAKQIFLAYDQAQIIRKYQLSADANYIYMVYLNTPCRICKVTGRVDEHLGNVWRECRNFSTVMTVYDILCHHKGEDAPSLLGRWCPVGNFVITGVTKTETFTRKYAVRFDGNLKKLEAAARMLGGIVEPRIAGADLTIRFQVTPYFPVLLQFWTSDEEFPPKLLILWDQNTPAFMHFETTFYLQGDLLERLERTMEAIDKSPAAK